MFSSDLGTLPSKIVTQPVIQEAMDNSKENISSPVLQISGTVAQILPLTLGLCHKASESIQKVHKQYPDCFIYSSSLLLKQCYAWLAIAYSCMGRI